MIVTVKRDIPDDILKKYDYEDTMRLPKNGDTIFYCGRAIEVSGGYFDEYIILIPRPNIVWPAWFTKPWVAFDGEQWCWYDHEPQDRGNYVTLRYGEFGPITGVADTSWLPEADRRWILKNPNCQ